MSESKRNEGSIHKYCYQVYLILTTKLNDNVRRDLITIVGRAHSWLRFFCVSKVDDPPRRRRLDCSSCCFCGYSNIDTCVVVVVVVVSSFFVRIMSERKQCATS